MGENIPCTPTDGHKGENNLPIDMKQENWRFFKNENDKSGLMIRTNPKCEEGIE